MKIIKNNSSSPFKLARGIVSQGGEGGAYESGGFDPNAYDRSGEITVAALEGMSNAIGAGLSSMTKTDINKMNIKDNNRRAKRVDNIDKKINKRQNKVPGRPSSDKKTQRLIERKERIKGRIDSTDKKIKEYEEIYGKDIVTSNDFLNAQRTGY